MSSFSERRDFPSYEQREVLVKCPSCGQVRVSNVHGGYCSECNPATDKKERDKEV